MSKTGAKKPGVKKPVSKVAGIPPRNRTRPAAMKPKKSKK